jgi:glyoxylase-like metal-dependent hydrolase (beta-lactamase superfamily II)
MKAGDFSLHVLSDGYIKLDGGAMFGQIPKVIWQKIAKPDRQNRIRSGLNCLLIRAGERNILVDTGVGSKESQSFKDLYGFSNSRLVNNIKSIGLTVKDIDTVILTNLHFDHSGGSTKLNHKGKPVPTFPKAKYYVQKSCWEHAINPNEKEKAFIRPDDFLPLQEQGQLELLDGDAEIATGVKIKRTNGHCYGHQTVLVNQGCNKALFLGDLVPTCHHLQLNYLTAIDQFPEYTLSEKREFLSSAKKDGSLIIFPHGYEDKAGYLEQRNGKVRLRVVKV